MAANDPAPGETAGPFDRSMSVRVLAPGLFLLALAVMLFTFREGLVNMVAFWESPEYSHGYLIPFISLYLLAARLKLLDSVKPAASWAGVAVVLCGLAGFFLGELSALYVIVQYSFVLTLWGLVITQVGWRGLKVLWPVLIFLLFMVPLPRFIQWNLSNDLQLISSQLGTGFLRLTGIPVFLQGNVIDLGNYKLQVVEACAGLRYLFPLMAFALLCAVMFRGAIWQRVLLFFSSLPIAIVMNSFRIAVTGVLVNSYGTSAAEGFLHYFEGWVIFTLCLALLFLEMWALARLGGRSLDEVFDLDLPGRTALPGLTALLAPNRQLGAAVLLLVLAALGSFAIANRVEEEPARTPLTAFPLKLGDWRGTESVLPPEQLEELKLTDYIMASYARPGLSQPVELYVAYYASQRKGASIHSPKACLPGGGWVIDEFSQVSVPGAGPDSATGDALAVNRTLISLGPQRMLVYYWFEQRGRHITNEYLAKWYIFQDSLLMNRTDGALVRVITVLPEGSDVEIADQRLQEFIRVAAPRLGYHIPGVAPVGAPSGAIDVESRLKPLLRQ
jgi:exosortase D (VPLPA-CTERM-specific)